MADSGLAGREMRVDEPQAGSDQITLPRVLPLGSSEHVLTAYDPGGADLMVDASLLLHRGTFPTVRQATEEHEGLRVSGALVAALDRLDDPSFTDFFVPRRYLAEPNEVRRFLATRGVSPYEGSLPDDSPLGLGFFLDETYGDELLARVLADEWAFLTQNSWIASRTKRTFHVFKRGGAIAIEFPRSAFDRMVLRTPGINAPPVPAALGPGQRLRAVSKWVASAGTPWLAFLGPLAVAAGAAVAGMYLLWDP